MPARHYRCMGNKLTRPARSDAQPALPEANIRNTIKKAIDATSVNRVATALGLSSEATLRLAGGLPVQTGTLLVAANLPRRENGDERNQAPTFLREALPERLPRATQGSRRPRPRPNDVLHDVDTTHDTNGFRAWTELPSDTLVECTCGWSGLRQSPLERSARSLGMASAPATPHRAPRAGRRRPRLSRGRRRGA